ncbi:helix-turn-helix domain-containing protein [Methylobacterium sp. WSM2598]|uniref:helix-turn-helix domain-containing protein n=1 Tax=Methylobacterium sp. WSM2598 TaxID=398261 RepID=UPI000365F013|nr:LexA family transcriptional regulator [Methylobacterium sp. WSM2598]
MALPELKRLREQRGLSQEAVATAVGLSVSQISRIESGKRDPGLTDLEKMAAFFGVAVQDIVNPSAAASPVIRVGLLPVPIIGRTAAGVFREVVEFEDAEPEYVFEPEDEDYPKARRFALLVEGDSMNASDPPIPDGSRVVCVDFEATGQPFTDGMIVVIERTREGGHLREWSIKEVELHDDEVWFCPRSTNLRHKPIKIMNDPSDKGWTSLEVIGLVREVSRSVRIKTARKR